MDVLKELIVLLNNQGLQTFKKSDSKTKLFLLYEGLRTGRFQSEQQAALALYQDQVNSPKFRKLKSDLQERLIHAVLQLDLSKDARTDYQKAYYEYHKQWTIFKTLAGLSANVVALFIANRLLKQAQKYDLTLLALDVAGYLRVHYGLREPNDKKYQKFSTLFQQYEQLFVAENQAEGLYADLMVKCVNNRSYQESVAKNAEQHWQKVLPLMEEMQSYKLQMYGYLIGLKRFSNPADALQNAALSKAAIQFFENRPYQAWVPLQLFYYQRLSTSVRLQNLDDGELAAKKCLSFLAVGTFNWFKFNELYLKLIFNAGVFEKSSLVLDSVISHPRFKFLPNNVKEMWRIYEAYVCWLSKLGRAPVTKSSDTFKLYKFLNEVPIFSKDKRGVNVAILIIKFLWMLQERRGHHLQDEVSALDQYCYRHLTGPNEKRSHTFIKMLLQFPVCGFDVTLVEAKVGTNLQKIMQGSKTNTAHIEENEIIPYETLWQMVLESQGEE